MTIRGLLCASCNVGLSHFGDSARTLREAADYLDRLSATSKAIDAVVPRDLRPRRENPVDRRRLADGLARQVKQWIADGLSDSEIARRVGLKSSSIYSIRIGKSYQDIV
jgi:hypothetical protein